MIETSFQYNTTFAAPPPGNGGSEPIWDSMIPSISDFRKHVHKQHLNIITPDGLGYIKGGPTASETSVLSTFHQLHCLVDYGSIAEIQFLLTRISIQSAGRFIPARSQETSKTLISERQGNHTWLIVSTTYDKGSCAQQTRRLNPPSIASMGF